MIISILKLSFVISDLSWNGDENIATYSIQGGIWNQHGQYFPPTDMFDGNSNTMWHSTESGSSVTVDFRRVIDFKILRILTRARAYNDKYKNVCLYADDEEVYCTG